MHTCPLCLGICNCRSCLRNGLPALQLPAQTAEQQLRHQRHVLRLVAPHVAAMLKGEEREVCVCFYGVGWSQGICDVGSKPSGLV